MEASCQIIKTEVDSDSEEKKLESIVQDADSVTLTEKSNSQDERETSIGESSSLLPFPERKSSCSRMAVDKSTKVALKKST